MKTYQLDAPVDALRRKLMLGLPGSLVMATPLGLVACGGSDDQSAAPPADSGPSLPPIERSVLALKLELPAGTKVSLTESRLMTANNISQVAADGTAGAVLLRGAPQMAYLMAADGRLLLMGVVEAGRAVVNSRTSAEALIFIASEAGLLEPALQIALRVVLQTHAIVEPVRLAVEGALLRNGITDQDPELVAALIAAVSVIRRRAPAAAASAEGRAHALKVTIAPTDLISGVSVKHAAGFNNVVFRNTFRRRAHVWVEQVSYFDSKGKLFELPTPRLQKPSFDLSATTALSFDNIVKQVGDFLAQLFVDVGLIDKIQGDRAPFFFVDSEPIFLPILPEAAQSSLYRTRVIGIGQTKANEALTPEETEKLNALLVATVWDDFVVPIMQTLVLPLISDRLGPLFQNEVKKVWLATMGIDLVNLVFLTNAFPNTVAFVKQGDASGALLAFWNEIVTSNTLQDLLKSSISAFITASVGPDQLPLTVYDSAGNIHGVNLLGTDLPGKVAQFQAGFARVAKTIVLVKAALTVADFAAMGKDWASSAHRSQFQLASSGTTIAITPAALSALPGQSVQLSAALGETADLGAGSVIRYEWSVSGSAGGSLRNPASQSAGTTISSSTGTVDYVAAAGAAAGATDQIDVKAILTDIGTQGGGVIAVAMKPAVVTISAVRLTPASVEFKRMLSGQRQDFTVEFSTAFGSPTGLVYEWSCPSVSGFISDNAQLSSTAAPSFRSTLTKVAYSSGAAIEAEAVKVRVLRITSAPGAVTETTETIATLESNVTYGNIALGINPSTPTDMPTDSSMGITAFVKEPPLPPGSTVKWAWSLLGAGSRVAVPDDANLADNSVTFNSASTEGPVTLTVHATIVVPVSGAQQAYTIITDPVSATLNVKKGLKTVTVEGYFQLEQGSKPLAVPKCGLDGQGKEVCLLGYLDTWGTYIVPKVANAESYKITLLNPAGDVVHTYDVPSQYPIGGPVVQDGGGTLRIRFWGSDSPYGSYDGVSDYGITQATQSAGILRRARTELPRVVAVVTLKP